jgi:hypothetical protein
MRRVREGSTGVFGSAAMLPHPGLLPEELHSMVAFVLALRPENAGEVHAGLAGAATLSMDAAPSGTLVLQATYADTGGGPVGSLTGEDRIRLRTRRVEAEHFSTRVGTAVLESESASGGRFIGSIDDGHLLRFARVRLDGTERVRVGVSSAGGGGVIEFRADDSEGECLARIEVVPNGHWERWFELEAPIRAPVHAGDPAGRALDLVVRFANREAPSALLNLDWIEFSPPREPSASTPLPPAPR